MYFYYDLDPGAPAFPGKTDATRLWDFLNDVQWFLLRLTKHRPAFAQQVYDDVVDAWKAAEVRFESAKNAVVNVAQDALKNAGLTGPELKLKLRNVEHGFGELLTKHAGETLRHFFDTIDSLLKSIADACGVGTALEEIKDALRDAMAWAHT